ncbi:alpha/beta hydrolase [Polyangium sp. 15x6]|uniref:alpha/beta fold hydrolase n=1 Tax=Polyangium sp. 15x6 TaxID=3042687 RepID=UPI002499C687|nr:alpha/beta hydrolase [Polyangium sp. 15x6]MDI3287552.1 alpha/beta hydrolase [Polyangium sp. 15x6]
MADKTSDPPARVLRDVNARGVRMRVLEAGSGPALLLVHGFLVSHRSFDDIIDALAPRFHVIAPDLPGFGESEKPSPTRYPYGIEAFAESMADLIAAFGVGRASVIGHGMGAAVALTLAAEHPELVTRLVVEDALCYPFPLSLRGRLPLLPVIGGAIFKQLYGRRTFRSYFRDEFFRPGAALPHERIDQHYDFFNGPSARESAYAVLRAILDTRPIVARITRITTPTLVVWGRDDRIFPAASAQRLARELPQAKLAILDAAHAPHEERPREFADLAAQFLEGKR